MCSHAQTKAVRPFSQYSDVKIVLSCTNKGQFLWHPPSHPPTQTPPPQGAGIGTLGQSAPNQTNPPTHRPQTPLPGGTTLKQRSDADNCTKPGEMDPTDAWTVDKHRYSTKYFCSSEDSADSVCINLVLIFILTLTFILILSNCCFCYWPYTGHHGCCECSTNRGRIALHCVLHSASTALS